MTAGPTLPALLEHQASSTQLPGWLRVTLWCWSHADRHGHARAYAGQLQADLGFTAPGNVSKALALARDRGLVDDCSSASCVVVPGHAIAPCEANHRGLP